MAFKSLFHIVMQMFVPAGEGDPSPRGKLIAYVHEDGHLVQHHEHEGTTTIDTIFRNRPDKCRFAILQTWDGGVTYTVIDMYECRFVLETHDASKFVAGPQWVFKTEDEAVACAQMQL